MNNKTSLAGFFLAATLTTGQIAMAAGHSSAETGVSVKNEPDITCQNPQEHVFQDEKSEQLRRAIALLVLALSRSPSIISVPKVPENCLPATDNLPEERNDGAVYPLLKFPSFGA